MIIGEQILINNVGRLGIVLQFRNPASQMNLKISILQEWEHDIKENTVKNKLFEKSLLGNINFYYNIFKYIFIMYTCGRSITAV